MKQVEQRPGGGRARPAAESGEVQGEDVDFDLDGPLNSGPRSNITFLPAILDLYAGQHRAWHSPFALLCGTDTPTIGTLHAFLCAVSLPESGCELHEGRNYLCVPLCPQGLVPSRGFISMCQMSELLLSVMKAGLLQPTGCP